jgi:hypothetical protein
MDNIGYSIFVTMEKKLQILEKSVRVQRMKGAVLLLVLIK